MVSVLLHMSFSLCHNGSEPLFVAASRMYFAFSVIFATAAVKKFRNFVLNLQSNETTDGNSDSSDDDEDYSESSYDEEDNS